MYLGFPTCFVSPLSDILCGDFNVCGIASCATETVTNHIVKFKCNHNCREPDNVTKEPFFKFKSHNSYYFHFKFCQNPVSKSTLPANITSMWSDWSLPSCVDALCQTLITEARCINLFTYVVFS